MNLVGRDGSLKLGTFQVKYGEGRLAYGSSEFIWYYTDVYYKLRGFSISFRSLFGTLRFKTSP